MAMVNSSIVAGRGECVNAETREKSTESQESPSYQNLRSDSRKHVGIRSKTLPKYNRKSMHIFGIAVKKPAVLKIRAAGLR
ncbi:hypothetical protein GC170_08740 [bacterium]|nr:hypothetical protein [bacterium]